MATLQELVSANFTDEKTELGGSKGLAQATQWAGSGGGV